MKAELKDRALWERIATRQAKAHEGFTIEDARTLRRAQLTLHRWAELECGTEAGHIEEATGPDGKPYTLFRPSGRLIGGKFHEPKAYRVPNREAGALRRVAQVCEEAGLYFYHQTDPRGCALYVGAEPLTASNYSSRGIPCL